jgi:ribosomal protein L11 methyltransferase
VCAAEAVEAVTELFANYGFTQGVVIAESSPPGGHDTLEGVAPGSFVSVSSALRTGDLADEDLEDVRQLLWVLRQGLWILGRSHEVGALEIVERPEEEWTNNWKSNFSLLQVGDGLLVKAPWHDYAAQPGELVIEVDPGTAFGTGRHPSSQLCLQALAAELVAGASVLDVGTGSGLLATAAALLGAGTVDGVDIDPVAIGAARETAARNGVGEIVRVALGSLGPDGPFPGPYDLVVANIIAGVLIELAPDLARAVAPGGTLILGGIIDEKEDSVHEAFAAAPLTLARRIEHEDWVALVWRKSA